jgi:6-phosphogluconolactonase
MASPPIVGKTDELVRELARRLRGHVAVTGGSLAPAFFPRLDWSGLSVWWGDERAVPYDDPESNYGVARAHLRGATLHPMPATSADLDAAARDYERQLCAALGTPPVLDVALLGMGPDGHVCSLFPEHELLGEARRFVAPLFDSPKPPPRRLTLTLPTLAAARLVIFVVTGASKAPAVRAALTGPSNPAGLVAARARDLLWLLDEAAYGR